MEEFFEPLLGLSVEADRLTAGQMCARTVIVFFVALALLRLAGQRTLGSGSSFDTVIKITLGAILSRAVVGASPFGPTLLACLVLVVLRRLLAWATCYSDALGRLTKGKALLLAENGQRKPEHLRAAGISERDLLEGVRESANLGSVEETQAVYLERNGKISTVKKLP